MTDILMIAMQYCSKGWNPVPMPFRTKAPTSTGWQNRVIDAASAPQFFNGGPQNIGVVLGATSRGLTDIDLDCREARGIAPYVLPKTDSIFGRASSRFAHWLYYTDLAITAEKAALAFDDPNLKGDECRLLELRTGPGAQTVFPGSVHKDGEPIVWHENGEPLSVDGAELTKWCRRVAAYTLLARYWPKPGAHLAHDAARVLGGFLARAGLTRGEIKIAADAICRTAGDTDVKDRVRAAEDAAKSHQDGGHAFGLSGLRTTFGEKTADKVAEWLEYDSAKTEPSEASNPEQKCGPLPFINMSNWDDEPVPEYEWAVLDRIPLRQTYLFSGEGAVGKSIVQLHECTAHVLGRDWLGTMPEPGPAMFIDAEDDERVLHIRLAAILSHYGTSFTEAINSGLYLISLVGEDAVLGALTRSGKIEPTLRYKQLLEAAGDIKPKMIGIASSADVFAGNENDRGQVKQFIGLLTKIAIVANGSVSLIAHPSLTGINTGTGLSGTTQWHNSVRARAYMTSVKPEKDEQPDSDLREIIFKKNQYGRVSAQIVVEYKNGLFLPVPGISSLTQAAQTQKAEEVFLDLLCRFTQANRNVGDKVGPNYAPALFAREDEAKKAGIKSTAFATAMRNLFKDGKIWNEPCGRPYRPAYRLAIK